MTTGVISVRRDLRVEAVTALLLDQGISGVPVIDDDGLPVGVISKTDLVRIPRNDGDGDLTVGEIMMPLAFTLREHDSIARAAALMAFEGIHRIPVVSTAGKVVGVLSSLDILRWLAGHNGYLGRMPSPAPSSVQDAGASE